LRAAAVQGLVMTTNREREPAESAARSDFERLFLEHYGRIVAVLVRLVGERARAEELANETFWKLSRLRLLPEPDGNVGGWLYRTATHLAIDGMRSTARRQHYERAAMEAQQRSVREPGPLDDLLRDERCRRVRGVLAGIKPAHAQALILRSSGFSYKEVADVLGVKPGSVGTLLIRAEAEFRQRYLQEHGAEEAV
jgi:RNA polymerase sigma factor (sigma-70 family)